MKKKVQKEYDKEHDIFAMNWGGEVEHSLELFEGRLILDIDKDSKIVGMEIFNFMDEIREHDKKMEKLFG